MTPAEIGSCHNCGNCRGWDDDGHGSGEYICKLDETGAPPECNPDGTCPGWRPITEADLEEIRAGDPDPAYYEEADE